MIEIFFAGFDRFARLKAKFLWFRPVIRIVRRQLRGERELTCVNLVLAQGGEPSAYAKLLLDWHTRRRTASLIAVGIEHRSPDLRRGTVAAAGITGALFLALSGTLSLAIIGLTEAIAALPASAQTQPPAVKSTGQPATRPRFDVVSVKPCKPGNESGVFEQRPSPGTLRIDCDILAATDNSGLIQVAYNRYASGQLTSLTAIPIVGGPDWIHSEKYDIEAKTDGHPSTSMMEGPMLQTILEDRFGLKIHRETRQRAVYELVLGKGPQKLKPLQEGSCIPMVLGSPLPVVPEGQKICGSSVSPRGSIDMLGATLSMLATSLTRVLNRPVIDKTGSTGYFEMHLAFTPDDSAAAQPATADSVASASVPPEHPRIFEAIQEQLGLRLVSAKGPVDVLVIDHIERPSEN